MSPIIISSIKLHKLGKRTKSPAEKFIINRKTVGGQKCRSQISRLENYLTRDR